MKPVAIIGVGNYLMGDEGVGIHATQRLRKEFIRDDCDIIDAGVPSMALLHMIEGRNFVIIIDCADFGGAPGEIKVFKPENVKREENKEISLHATDLLTTLDLGKSIGLALPPISIIGIQPARVEQTMKLSDQLSRALEKIHEVIEQIITS